MLGILGGLLAACFWGGAGTCSARCARALGSLRSLAIGNVIGVVLVSGAALAVHGPPTGAPASDWLRGIGYGLGTMAGLACIFKAYELAKVGLVSATVSTNGAIAALVSVLLLGEELAPVAILALVVTATGVSLSALRGGQGGPAGGSNARGVAFALLGACGFATAILVGSDLESLGPIWIVATGRAVGVVVVTVPLALARALPRPERGLWPWLLGSPAFDAAGFAALLLATQDGVAVPAVIANMSVVLLSLIAMVVFDERLGRLQWVGVATTLSGVAVLAATQG